ncbi:type II toxin-antitoxin system HicA family toxin [Streptococcus pseudoporcinus]|uniref:type II toxin-antitoxin system HicA family toxin n=1 Tax=Streptococcus pseudoporcinus TaxID=361101 RepID=UPI000987C869|nr:type II toxin-antitoxin system HicA family toxin [Streptococcus pseudoporcinus]
MYAYCAYKELAKIAKENGWDEVRVRGSHHHFMKKEISKIVTIPIHGNKDLGKGLEKKIPKDLGLKQYLYLCFLLMIGEIIPCYFS